jgi:Putative peptidoglycan binding domain/L,D-transpeptidase catalytic domain
MNRTRTLARRAAPAAILAALTVADPAAAQAPPPAVTLKASPAQPALGAPVRLTGTVTPAGIQPVSVTVQPPGGAPTQLAAGTTRADGTFALKARASVPGDLVALAGAAASPPVRLTLRPRLTARWTGTRLPGGRIALRGRLTPATAGAVRVAGTAVRVGADGRFRLRTRAARAGRRCARVRLRGAPGYATLARRRCVSIAAPSLAAGSRGPAVRFLERRLDRLRYLLSNTNASFGADTRDAVYAFQKIERLARTGVVGPAMWNALARARTPRASRRGTHIEVHKGRQVLLEVHGGRVKHVVNTSTGLTGNTPVGRWRIYRKDTGYNALGMLDALYFIGGYAVHGYHSVPPYQASHGCARIPLWAAHGVFSRWEIGDTVYVL